MGWMAVAAIGGAVISGVASNSASRRQRAAQEEQARIAREQLALAREQFGLGRDAWNTWRNIYLPYAERLLSDATREIRPDYERIAGDIRGQFAAARGGEERALRRYGISPIDGMSRAARVKSNNAEATAHVLARNVARRGATQDRFRNMMAAFGTGNLIPSAAVGMMGGTSAAYSTAGSAYGNLAGQYGQEAQDRAQAAGNIWGSIPWERIFAANAGGGGGGTMPGYGPSYSYPGSPGSGAWGTTNWSVPSSVDRKTGITRFSGKHALDVVSETPVIQFRYKPGAGPGGKRIGTVAELAPREVSDGRSNDLANQVGVLTAGMQELMKRLGMGSGATRAGSAAAKGLTPPGSTGGGEVTQPVTPPMADGAPQSLPSAPGASAGLSAIAGAMPRRIYQVN